MDTVDEFLAGESMNPGLVRTAPSAQFGDDHETIRVWMESLLDDLIGHMRSVVVAGINVVYAGLDCLAKNGDGGIDVPRWSPDAGSGKLHRTVSHAVQSHRCSGQHKASSETSLFNHSVPPCYNHLMKDSSGLEFAYAG